MWAKWFNGKAMLCGKCGWWKCIWLSAAAFYFMNNNAFGWSHQISLECKTINSRFDVAKPKGLKNYHSFSNPPSHRNIFGLMRFVELECVSARPCMYSCRGTYFEIIRPFVAVRQFQQSNTHSARVFSGWYRVAHPKMYAKRFALYILHSILLSHRSFSLAGWLAGFRALAYKICQHE